MGGGWRLLAQTRAPDARTETSSGGLTHLAGGGLLVGKLADVLEMAALVPIDKHRDCRRHPAHSLGRPTFRRLSFSGG